MKTGSNVTPELAAEMGLSVEEFDRAVGLDAEIKLKRRGA